MIRETAVRSAALPLRSERDLDPLVEEHRAGFYGLGVYSLWESRDEEEAVTILRALRAKAPAYREDGRDAFFAAGQNTLVPRNAEVYYRMMVRSGPSSRSMSENG